jgi:hypothetical protein
MNKHVYTIANKFEFGVKQSLTLHGIEFYIIAWWFYVEKEFKDNKGTIRRTDNTMAKRTRLHIKLKIEQYEPTENRGWSQVIQKGEQFLLH